MHGSERFLLKDCPKRGPAPLSTSFLLFVLFFCDPSAGSVFVELLHLAAGLFNVPAAVVVFFENRCKEENRFEVFSVAL